MLGRFLSLSCYDKHSELYKDGFDWSIEHYDYFITLWKARCGKSRFLVQVRRCGQACFCIFHLLVSILRIRIHTTVGPTSTGVLTPVPRPPSWCAPVILKNKELSLDVFGPSINFISLLTAAAWRLSLWDMSRSLGAASTVAMMATKAARAKRMMKPVLMADGFR